MSQAARFQLFVKAGQDGKCFGDCPFSQRAYMFSRLKVDPADIEVTPVNLADRPESFLQLNPDGKVPVLVDRQEANKIIADSGKIIDYFDSLYPLPGVNKVNPAATDAISGIFPKFAAFMKNKDGYAESGLRDALIAELKKFNEYLDQKVESDAFVVCDQLCDADCQILPKLRHVQIAGKHYKQFEIPQELSALHRYIKCGEATDVFKNTCPEDSQIIWGWSKLFT